MRNAVAGSGSGAGLGGGAPLPVVRGVPGGRRHRTGVLAQRGGRPGSRSSRSAGGTGSRRCWPSASGSRRSGPSSSPRRSGSSASRSRGPAGRSGLLPHPRWSRPGRAPCSCCGATRWVQVVSRSTTRPSAVRTSIDASSSGLAAVAAVTSIGRPSTDRAADPLRAAVASPHEQHVVDLGRQLVLHPRRVVGAGETQPSAPGDLFQADRGPHRHLPDRLHRPCDHFRACGVGRCRGGGGGARARDGRRHRIVAAVARDLRHRHRCDERDRGGREPGHRDGTATPRAPHPTGQGRQQRIRHRLLDRRLLHEARVDPTEKAGEASQLADRSPAARTPGQVPLELPPLGRGQDAEHVGAVVVREPTAHGPTPSSSSASFNARSA